MVSMTKQFLADVTFFTLCWIQMERTTKMINLRHFCYKKIILKRRYDIQHNDFHHNDIQHNDIMTISKETLCIECHYAACHVSSSVLLNVVMLSVVMLNVEAPFVTTIREEKLVTVEYKLYNLL